jgi:hypothetical protein
MDNGDSIVGEAWYQELAIVNDPGNSNRYFLFSVGIDNLALQQGFYYSIIDMSYNGGLGKVISKNNQLLNSYMTDCLAAVKHGNGRDWWIVCRPSNVLTTGQPVDYYNFYLVSPSGVSAPFVRHTGFPTNYDLADLTFSKSGTKAMYLNPRGLIDYYSVDRCAGNLSLISTLSPENTYYHYYWSGEFSEDETKFYIQTVAYPDTNYLIQFDLNSANIMATADTLDVQVFPTQVAGYLKLAPNNKVYLSKWYYDGVNFSFPYSDTTYNIYNTYMGVINQPDSLGAACNFQPYSFYLGGYRTYIGLPNNPDYTLGRDTGSVCDSLTAIQEQEFMHDGFSVFPNPFYNKLNLIFTKESSLQQTELTIHNSLGELIFEKKNLSAFETVDLSFASKGIYFLTVKSENKLVTKRVVKL